MQLLARALTAVAAAACPDGWRLVELAGGEKRNAIARDAHAMLLVRLRGASSWASVQGGQ